MKREKQKSWVEIIAVPILAIAILFFINTFICQGHKDSDVTKEKSISSSKISETSFERKSRKIGIDIGTSADDVLAIRGKPLTVEVIGKDVNGLIVEWEYPDGIYVFRIYEINGISRYRVTEMKL